MQLDGAVAAEDCVMVIEAKTMLTSKYAEDLRDKISRLK
jgi:hypothetical protein